MMPIGQITMQKCEAKHSGANHYSKIVTILSKKIQNYAKNLKRNCSRSETYFLTKRSETFEAKQSEIFFPEFREKEAKPSETVCVSLSFALK